MKRVFKRGHIRVDEENPYWVSFSDLMSALLVIFLLAVVALIIELTEKTQEITQKVQKVDAGIDELRRAEQARQDILNEVKSELERMNIIVEIADNDTVIRIPERTLTFKSGADRFPRNDETLKAVTHIGEVLHTAILKNERFKYLDTVFVEGHTDSDSIKYRGKGNWGLSADRAISVWKAWISNENLDPRFNEMGNHSGEQLFSVSGYAATRRIELSEVTDSDKTRNRRIDIRFTVKRPSISQLERITD